MNKLVIKKKLSAMDASKEVGHKGNTTDTLNNVPCIMQLRISDPALDS